MEEHSILPAFVRRIDEISVDSLPQMPVPQSFDHLIAVRLNKLLRKKPGAGVMTFNEEGNHISR